MNNVKRKALQIIADQLADLLSQIDTIKDEEQDAYDAMPESFQNGERGEKSQTAIDAMNDASSSLEQVITDIETAKE